MKILNRNGLSIDPWVTTSFRLSTRLYATDYLLVDPAIQTGFNLPYYSFSMCIYSSSVRILWETVSKAFLK